MRRLAAAGLVVAASAGVADAKVTTPVNRFVMELPYGWSVHRAFGELNEDVLQSSSSINAAIGFTESDCATFFAETMGMYGNTTDFAVPEGWAVRVYAMDGTPYLACRSSGGSRALVAQWWAPSYPEYTPGWESEISSLLSAMDQIQTVSPTSARHNLVSLAGTALAVQVPESLRVRLGDPDYHHDVLDLDSGDVVEVLHDGSSGCEAQSGDLPSAYDAPAGAVKWSDGVQERYCLEYSGSYVVSGPAGDPATRQLFESIQGELGTTSLGEVARLGGSRWRIGLPTGWSSRADGGADHLVGDGLELIVKRPGSCANALRGASGETYAPSWLDGVWEASADPSAQKVVFCAKTDAGNIELDAPFAAVEGQHRRVTALLLSNLYSESSWRAPPKHHKPLLGWPIGLAFQSVFGVDDPGYGGRLMLNITKFADLIGFRGELGYDSVHGLSYDARLQLFLPFGDHGAWGGVLGVDQIGLGDKNVLGVEPYYGFGLRIGKLSEKGAVYASGELVWRHQPDAPTDGTPLDTTMYPRHEWRAGLHMFLTDEGVKDNWIWGFDLDYRSHGDYSTVVAGIVTRL